MSDLISRSDVIKVLEECHLDEKLFEKDVFDKVKAIPTAYDVEKVVAELEEMKNDRDCQTYCYEFYKKKCKNYDKAIDIVRKGGVE